MRDNSIDETRIDNEEKIDIQELFFRYAIHWPWFVASIIICLIGAWTYLYFTTPIYNISASIIIKDDKRGRNSGANMGLEDLGLTGLMSSSQNIDNEIEVLRSKTIIKEVVNNLNLYLSYRDDDAFPSKDMYKTSPVLVNITPQEADKLTQPAIITLEYQPKGGLNVNIKVDEREYSKKFDKLPCVFPTDEGTFSFIENNDSIFRKKNSQNKETATGIHNITVTVYQPLRVAKAYLQNLTIEPTSKTTSVAAITLKNSSQQRGQDFINELLSMYNRNTNNDKNEISQKTKEFIDERIGFINEELGTTEDELATFKSNAGVIDPSSDAQLTLSENAEYDKKRVENGTQISLVNDLSKYINNPANEYEVLPSNVGLRDAALAGQIERFNEVIIERKRLLRTSTENNPAIINLDTSIKAIKTNVKTTIQATLQGLQITKNDLEREAGRFNQRISSAPRLVKQLGSMERQREIKANLYLMLLQKREENEITLAATANNAKIIDDAISDEIPVSPKGKLIYLIALVLGVGIPVGIIYVIGLTQFKIEGRADVEKLTSAPIIGDIPLTDEKDRKEGSIAVFENQNNQMSEVFRNIRTNLQFMLQNDKKVILVTSTVSGEGKSFVSSNIAISFSLLGKKVVIVGLDIRKPGLNKVFSISHKERGITQFLANTEIDLMDMVQQSSVSENLYILPGGTVPPNPTELLARNGLDKAIAILKEKFDYIILDTAPIGMVTDTQLIGRVADVSIYVCRADYTHKAEYTLINELLENNKLPHLCTIINGIDMKKKKYGYYYGYGKYGKYHGYGKGYGYGYDDETPEKK